MKCPICKKAVAEAGADRPKTYPFCSDRCKLIDLGRWLDGKYQIPVHPAGGGGDEENQPVPGDNDLPRRL